MSVSIISICNEALLLIGAQAIQALTENSAEAQYCNRLQDSTRIEVLRDFAWNFATKIDALAELDEEGYGHSYVYSLPSDSIRILKIFSYDNSSVVYLEDDEIITTDAQEFRRRGKKIYCNIEQAYAEYVYNVTDPNEFDAGFVEAFKLKLAAKLAMPISNDARQYANLTQQYQNALGRAKAADGKEDRTPLVFGRSFVDARS